MKPFKYNFQCDAISGSQEPSATPPVASSSQNSLDLFIGIMCRKVRLVHTSNVNYTDNISTKRFTPIKSTFDLNQDPKNGCYKHGQDPLLPSGKYDPLNLGSVGGVG